MGPQNMSFRRSSFLVSALLVAAFVSALLTPASARANAGLQFYSVDAAFSNLTAADMSTERPLTNIPVPPVLYHWISVSSINRLFPNQKAPSVMPLKSLGTKQYRSILVKHAPGFLNTPGLYAWNNPIGATIGGTGELYGNHESILAMKIRSSNVRMGLIITDESASSPTAALLDPRLAKKYDLILHANGAVFDGKFWPGYIEWALINPKIVEAVTADPTILTTAMKPYFDALNLVASQPQQPSIPAIEVIAGHQHSGLVSFSIDGPFVLDLGHKIMKNKSRLPKWLANGWTTF